MAPGESLVLLGHIINIMKQIFMQDELRSVCLLFQNPKSQVSPGSLPPGAWSRGGCRAAPPLLAASAGGAAIAMSSAGACYQQHQPGTVHLTVML